MFVKISHFYGVNETNVHLSPISLDVFMKNMNLHINIHWSHLKVPFTYLKAVRESSNLLLLLDSPNFYLKAICTFTTRGSLQAIQSDTNFRSISTCDAFCIFLSRSSYYTFQGECNAFV